MTLQERLVRNYTILVLGGRGIDTIPERHKEAVEKEIERRIKEIKSL